MRSKHGSSALRRHKLGERFRVALCRTTGRRVLSRIDPECRVLLAGRFACSLPVFEHRCLQYKGKDYTTGQAMEPPDMSEPLTAPDNKVTRFYGCRALLDDVAWAVEESHVMIIELCCPCLLSATAEVQYKTVVVRYNPFYWALLIILVASILLGRWTHAIFGQGGPVREDELKIERQVRIQWIYAK